MTKIIGIKELQTNTKKIRQEVEKGVSFVVVWRSKPIFEIKPLENFEFAENMRSTDLYTDDFIHRMEKAEKDLRQGREKTYKSPQEFLKSIA